MFLSAETPPDNSIPIIGMRASGIYSSFSSLKLPFLCELSWLHFNGVEVEGPAWRFENQNFMGLCGEAGMLLVLAPKEIVQYYSNWDSLTSYWFRWTDYALTFSSCFGQTSCNDDHTEWNEPHNTATAQEMFDGEDYSIRTTVVEQLSEYTDDYPSLWFYDIYDEVPARQRHNMLDTLMWNDWIPNMYTQQWDNNPNPPVPALSEVEPAGIFSWQKHLAETNGTNAIPTTINFSLLHTIQEGEYTGFPGCDYGTMARQAISVRAFCEAMYQAPPDGFNIPVPLDNSPEFICFDYYPFRYVDIDYASTTTMCDDDWLFLVNHFEEGIDSTVIPAREYDVPVFFYPQTFGSVGGPSVRDSSGNLDYTSYNGRTPAKQEFLMLCNLGLLHQVKAIFPYSLASYVENTVDPDNEDNFISSSLLDMHSIPFDAPYEDWVYTGRWPDQGDWKDKYEYADPQELPPFMNGFDPLYELPPPPPVPVPPDPKYNERLYTWLFEPYSNVYNSLENTLGQIVWIAPEMYDLWWWEENGIPYWDAAQISCPDSDIVVNYISPRIKLFRQEGSDHTYLFYVNRYCGDFFNGENHALPVRITIRGRYCPGYLSEDALDHSRRCLVPIDRWIQDWYSFYDTLAAGESRLLEFVDISPPTQADLRVTSPDVFCSFITSDARITELRCRAGESMKLGATYYNMGTSGTGNVTVTFTDHSGASPTVIGSDVISLGGLSQYYEPDSTSAAIVWNTDSGDIGAHIIEISAATVSGEDPLDNTVRVTVLVEPLDYATEVRNDAWDMTEAASSPIPVWLTRDIDATSGEWNDLMWTDSVSGMFEGVLAIPSGDMYIGNISLDVPVDIDTEQYKFFSMGVVGNNSYEAGNACGVFISWRKASGAYSDWFNLGFGPGNGWDQWTIRGPVDLDDLTAGKWSEENARELLLRFQCSKPEPPVRPEPIDLRIGWIRLENGEI